MNLNIQSNNLMNIIGTKNIFGDLFNSVNINKITLSNNNFINITIF